MENISSQTNEEIERMQHRISQAPDDHPRMPVWLGLLAIAYEKRFGALGQADDINKAIECASIAIAITSEDNPNLPFVLGALGRLHCGRFRHLGKLDDLNQAIEFQIRGLTSTLDGDSELGGYLANLGVSHKLRYEHLGGLADLEKAIEYENRALAVEPEDLAELSTRLNNIGVSYRFRYQRLGELADLEKAIESQSSALAFAPDDHPGLIIALSNLGVSHKIRYEHLGELADLETAIKHESRALALTPSGHPYMASRLANLAVSYTYKFQELEELADLESAIKLQSSALTLTPHGHYYLFGRLHNLGVSYTYRFQHLDELADLEKAIEYLSRALSLVPNGHTNLPTLLSSLGKFHKTRFERLREPGDLEKAFSYLSRALPLVHDEDPTLPVRHNTLAELYFLASQHTGDSSYLQKSLQSFRMACQSLSGAPGDKFGYAYRWATLASKHSALNPVEAYQTAIDLLPQFVWLGATATQRYENLTVAGALAVGAAVAAFTSSDYALALEWLENARCVVWNQSLMLRSPLDRLHSVDPGLSSRIQQVANQLHYASSQSRDYHLLSIDPAREEQAARERRRLAKEYDDLLSQARMLPGLDDFLRPMKANGLVRAARNGPVVVINCHQDRCDALAILPGEDLINHIALPNCTSEKVQQARLSIESSLRRKGIRERGVQRRHEPELKDVFRRVLAQLWYDVVQPVLEYLGCMSAAPTENLPHITWCPTGALSFLPLHAAGDYDKPRSRVFDYAISSYTPTLTAILASAPDASDNGRGLGVLAVGQANTPGHSSLPGTTQELAHVKAHAQNQAEYTQLIDDQATTASVLDAMDSHDWVHIACHAHQSVTDPTMSGFFLQDGTLDLASINRRSFKGKGLAFLSACQTAAGDNRLPDEAVHLASGMLMAGYPSVIGTMWSVSDEIAPFVADKVYERLLQGGKVGNGEAGRALHHAIGELREKVGQAEFGYWVPYIHIGS